METATLPEQTTDQPEQLSEQPTEQSYKQAQAIRDVEILRLKQAGFGDSEISRRLKLSRAWVQRSLVRSVKQFARDNGMKLTGTTKDVIAKRLLELAPTAVERVGQLMQSARKEDVQLRASQDVLDRSGFAPQRQQTASDALVLIQAVFNQVTQSAALRSVVQPLLPAPVDTPIYIGSAPAGIMSGGEGGNPPPGVVDTNKDNRETQHKNQVVMQNPQNFLADSATLSELFIQ